MKRNSSFPNLFKRWLVLVLALLSTTVQAASPSVQITLSPELISLTDQAVLKIIFENTKGEIVDFPHTPGLDVHDQGVSSRISIINMRKSSQFIHTYLLTPTQTGDFTIGPIICRYKGHEKKLTAHIRVIQSQQNPTVSSIGEMVFSTVETDTSAPYVQQPLKLTLNIFVRDGVQLDNSLNFVGGIPESGFKTVKEWDLKGTSREERDGAIYSVHTLQTTLLPLRSGTFTFQPILRMGLVVPRQDRRPFGFNDPFFGDLFGVQETHPITLKSNPIQLKIKPVPLENRPKSYSGAVGKRFTFSTQYTPNSVPCGDPVTLRYTIKGDGNLGEITAPKLSLSASNTLWKCYDPQLVENGSNSLVFEQVIIPQSVQCTSVPVSEFSYFDPKTEDFRILRTGPFPLQVTPSKSPPPLQQEPEQPLLNPIKKSRKIHLADSDLFYLQTPHHLTPAPSPSPFRQLLFWVAPLLLLILHFGAEHRTNYRRKNPGSVRKQKAPSAARKQIKAAKKALNNPHPEAFYQALWDACTHYLSHRLNLEPGEITLRDLNRRTAENSWIEILLPLLQRLESRRYGQQNKRPEETTLKALLQETITTLKQCEKIKR